MARLLPSLSTAAVIACLVGWTAASETPTLDAGLQIVRAVAPDQWRVSWTAQPGQRYRLQKSQGLTSWTDAAEITAATAQIEVEDEGFPDARRVFWRVQQLGAAMTTSSVVAAYQLGESASKALLQVSAEGTEPVAGVVFFENGVALGNAVPGEGNTWTFDLLWDGAAPRPAQISAAITGVDGTSGAVPVRRLLLADPAQFVPLGADGKPAYGQFVPLNADGSLAAFLFYPEGAGDSPRVTGAHFGFPAGATMEVSGPVPRIQFTSGKFFRSGEDEAPLDAVAGARSVPVSGVDPAAVAGALGLPAGTPMHLLWGRTPLRWRGGVLSPQGWAGLRLDLFIGELNLPGLQANAAVVFDPATGVPSLVVCYSGEWRPAPGGPLFRIPAADPLKVYLDLAGRFRASGTAEATFPNGSVARGSISWRDPNFEFRFQGKAINIPALNTLGGVLPQNPEECVPAGTGTAELDEAERCLTAFRDALRQTALGSSGQATTTAAAPATAPLATAEDPAAAALAGWAARLESWNADRSGTLLTVSAVTDLTRVIAEAGRLAEGAADTATVSRIGRHLFSLARTAPPLAPPGPEADALTAALTDARARLLAAATRIHQEIPATTDPADLAETAELLAAWAAPAAPAGLRNRRDGNGNADGDALEAALQAELIAAGTYGTFFDDLFIFPGDLNGNSNPALAALSMEELLETLDRASTLFVLLKVACGEDLVLGATPPQYPLRELLTQMYPWLVQRHQAVCAAAIAKGELGPLTAAATQRATIYRTLAVMGFTLPAGQPFTPPLRDLVLDMEAPFARQLASVSRELRPALLQSRVELLRDAALFEDDNLLDEHLTSAWENLQGSNSAFAALLFGAPQCDELETVLRNAFGFTLAPESIGEGSRAVPVTGQFEDSAGRQTLQLSQAGRYLKGYLQHHVGSATHRSVLEGVLSRDKSNLVEYAFILYAENNPQSLAAGILKGEIDGTRIRITLQRKFPSNDQRTTVFTQTTNVPVMAKSVTDAFPGEAGRIARALNRAPLHSNQVRMVMQEVPGLVHIIDNFTAAADGNARGIQASAFDRKIQRIKEKLVTPQQLPLVRLLLQQTLAKVRPAGNARTYWDMVTLMRAGHPNLMNVTAEMMGSSPVTPFGGAEFTYSCTISADGLGGNIRLLKLGGFLLKIHIQKSGPTGTDSFDLIGLVAQGGSGVEAKKNFGGAGKRPTGKDSGLPELPVDKLELEATTIVVKSPYDYRAEDLAGPVMGMSGEANLGLELKVPDAADLSGDLVKVDGSGLALFGKGILPPLILVKEAEFAGPEAPDVAVNFDGGDLEFEAGIAAGVNATVGYVTNEGDPLEFLTDPPPVRFSTSAGSSADGAVFFDTDSAVIRPCGRQFLRRLVAEYSGIFTSTRASIRVIGFTDPSGTPDANNRLSLNRAKSVRDALLDIAGPFVGIPAEDILAVGAGEEPAIGVNPDLIPVLGLAPASQNPSFVFPADGTVSLNASEPWIAKFIENRQGSIGTVPDGTGGDAGAPWRSVVVLLNNVAVMELTDSPASRP